MWIWRPGRIGEEGFMVDWCETEDYPCKLKTGEILSGNRNGYGRKVQCLYGEDGANNGDPNETAVIECPTGKKNQIVIKMHFEEV